MPFAAAVKVLSAVVAAASRAPSAAPSLASWAPLAAPRLAAPRLASRDAPAEAIEESL